MNLDNLKELKAKATPGELKSIALFGYGDDDDDKNQDIVLTLVIDKGGGNLTAIKMTDRDEKLYIALRNQAKEMIETIERYKSALEDVRDNCATIIQSRRAARRALKEPEKTT